MERSFLQDCKVNETIARELKRTLNKTTLEKHEKPE